MSAIRRRVDHFVSFIFKKYKSHKAQQKVSNVRTPPEERQGAILKLRKRQRIPGSITMQTHFVMHW